jgi:hypothetical protein
MIHKGDNQRRTDNTMVNRKEKEEKLTNNAIANRKRRKGQKTTKSTKERETCTTFKPGVNVMYSSRITNSCSIKGQIPCHGHLFTYTFYCF